MGVVLGDRQTIEARKQRQFESYQRWEAAEQKRLYDDETTWVAETLNAPMETNLEFDFHDNDLWARDGSNMGKVFKDAVEFYDRLALSQPELSFQAMRARAELDEYRLMLRMAAGDGANTAIIISPIPEQLRNSEQDILGYQPKRGLGFVRVIGRQPDGNIKLQSHSIDKSDPESINAIYELFGQTADWSRDLIDQRILVNINDTYEQELLIDRLLFTYDQSLNRRFGGSWFAGRSELDQREALQFVQSQSDAVDLHLKNMSAPGLSKADKKQLRYKLAATMKRRYEGRQIVDDGGDIGSEMDAAANDAAANGESYSGCGETNNANTNEVANSALAEAGYSQRRDSKLYDIDKCMRCPKCQYSGVEIDGRSGKIYYTCLNGCKATTKPASLRNKTKDTTSIKAMSAKQVITKKESLKPQIQNYDIQTQIVIGGMRRWAVHKDSGLALSEAETEQLLQTQLAAN